MNQKLARATHLANARIHTHTNHESKVVYSTINLHLIYALLSLCTQIHNAANASTGHSSRFGRSTNYDEMVFHKFRLLSRNRGGNAEKILHASIGVVLIFKKWDSPCLRYKMRCHLVRFLFFYIFFSASAESCSLKLKFWDEVFSLNGIILCE